MKFVLQNALKNNIYNLTRKLGYHFLGQDEGRGELSFVRPARGYPRFHLFVETDGSNLIFNLHLDQKKPVYKNSPAHAAEYKSELVQKEVKRIKMILKQYD